MRKPVILAVSVGLVACTGTSGISSRATSGPSARAPTTTVARRPHAIYDTRSLVADFERAGLRARPTATLVSSAPFVGTTETRLCVAGRHRVDVYEYGTARERRQSSAGIGSDGSTIKSPGGGISSVDWVGIPSFYARGRVIVLFLSASPSVRALLARVLGATLTPHGSGLRGVPALGCR